MNDEEKKAIERIEDIFYQDLGKGINKFQKITLYEDDITNIRKLLNLVEKQQKEIEEYKEHYENMKWYYDNQKDNLIHKDKIREKIEKLKEIADEDNPDDYIKIDAYEELLEE